MASPTQQEVLELFRRAAWENQQLELGEIDMNQSILELGVDSIAMAEIIAEIEDNYDVYVPDEKLAEARQWSVSKLINYIAKLAEE